MLLAALLAALPALSASATTGEAGKPAGKGANTVLGGAEADLTAGHTDLTQLTQSIDAGADVAGFPGNVELQAGDPASTDLPVAEPGLSRAAQQDEQGLPGVSRVDTNVRPVGGATTDISANTLGAGSRETVQAPPADLAASLEGGGESPLQPVRRTPTQRVWNALMEIRNDFGLNPKKTTLTEGESWAAKLATRIAGEMYSSARILPFNKTEYRLLYSGMVPALRKIGHHQDHGKVDLRIVPVFGKAGYQVERKKKPHFGSYPVAGDPLHWGHIYIALNAAAENYYDKVIFTFQGISPIHKPGLTPIGIRRPINDRLLSIFNGLFMNSGIENADPGEKTLFELLGEAAFWDHMAGADHGKLRKSNGMADTQLQLLEYMAARLYNYVPNLHNISGLFIPRRENDIIEDSALPKRELEEAVPVEISSSLIRDEGRYDLMPYTAFKMALRMAPRILLEQGSDLWGLNRWIGSRSRNPTGGD